MACSFLSLVEPITDYYYNYVAISLCLILLFKQGPTMLAVGPSWGCLGR